MRNCLFSVVLAVSVCAPAWAQVRLPSTDVPGAQDNRLLGRYEGSIVVDYRSNAYDDLTLPLSKLEPVPRKRDDRNNSRFALSVGRSPLEVLRNYRDVIKAGGGSIAFECRNETCGGDIDEGHSQAAGFVRVSPPVAAQAPAPAPVSSKSASKEQKSPATIDIGELVKGRLGDSGGGGGYHYWKAAPPAGKYPRGDRREARERSTQ